MRLLVFGSRCRGQGAWGWVFRRMAYDPESSGGVYPRPCPYIEIALITRLDKDFSYITVRAASTWLRFDKLRSRAFRVDLVAGQPHKISGVSSNDLLGEGYRFSFLCTRLLVLSLAVGWK